MWVKQNSIGGPATTAAFASALRPRCATRTSRRQGTMAGVVMVGKGEYNSASSGQTRSLMDMLPRIVECARHRQGPIAIADYGCSQGGAAHAVFKQIISACPNRNMVLFLVDQPGNDWDTVRQIFSEWTVEPSSSTCFLSSGDVVAAVSNPSTTPIRVFLCGVSFYEQVLPSGAVDIAISGTAIHWMSTRPRIGPENGILGGVSFRNLPAELRRDAEKSAADDWKCFLGHRNRELKSGGHMFFVIPAYDASFVECPFTWADYSDFMQRSTADLLKNGAITVEEAVKAQAPVYMRSRAEFEAPFKSAACSSVDGMKLTGIDLRALPNTEWDEDAERFAKKHQRAILAVMDNLWQNAFSQTVNDLLRRRLLDEIKSNPSPHKVNWLQAYITISKH
ncbi:unnamed protein product (mitochondrion) [Plasmodiophora brassicae]|uniref:Uncharacterized protein n=2 Tax=Plasmodiophora brassicae TaxID=37360 RepID=A0A3P3Y9L5_PLABS|nr:unnamed protein product [Plasmodiophora brassicae]